METPAERLKNLPLWVWGIFCWMGGAAAFIFGPQAHDRAELLGQSSARLLFFIIGAVLIILHLVRSRRS